jgi:hypothetical protein
MYFASRYGVNPKRPEEFFLQHFTRRNWCNFFHDLTPLVVIDDFHIAGTILSLHETDSPMADDSGNA